MVAPAFGQGMPPPYPPPVLDPVATQTYTLVETTVPLTNVQQDGTPITLYDDGNTRVQLPFEFYFFGNPFNSINISQNGYISFTGNSNGCCDGRPLPDFDMWSPYSDTRNSIFAMWNDLADFNNPGNPYTKAFEDRFVVGWYNIEELGTASQNCSFNLLGIPLFCNPVGPNRFNFEITLFRNYDFSINYGDINISNLREFERFTAGYQGDTSSEVYTIYYGNNPTALEYRTFTFVSDYAPIEVPVDTTVDCSLDPYDPTCIIDSLIPDTTEEVLADTTTEETGSDDGSDDGTEVVEEEEELLADEDMTDESFEELLDEEQLVADEETSEEQLEELLAEVEEESDSFAEPAVVATYRELSDEEKAAILADAISKNTLESALSIAAEATTSASTVAGSAESTSSSTSTRSSNESSSSTTTVSEKSTLLADDLSQQNEETATSDDALDILETGRQLGQQALSETLAASENASNESLAEAESIASSSSESSASQQSVVAINDTQSTDVNSSASEQQITETQVVSVIQEDTTQQEVTVADTNTEASVDMGMPTDTNTIDSTSQIVEEANMLADSLLRGPVVESIETDEALAVVESSRATSEQKTFDDESSKDAEVTTAMVDPALAMANTFNQAPNAMSLEFLGIIKPIEEKSDAEVRAEQVVAANKEQQDAINANYMDADQSGIVSAIAVDADVSSYLTQRIPDVPFYRPEDIYKGVIIKDNARGAYFLEKGNTDTYKKMVEEQYK